MVSTVAPFPAPLSTTVRVNIRLCGSVPRNELEVLSLGKRVPHHSSCSSEQLAGEPVLSGRGLAPSVAPTWPPYKEASCVSAPKLSLHHLSVQLSSAQRQAPQHRLPQPRRTCPSYDAPSWAVPAQGEARLEPVCEAVGLQNAVDLTTKAVYFVGRSPTSDVQLMHATSSRRHAMIFHHSNGSCYVVDCASAHGTFVNGVRVNSSSQGDSVIPHRVRRGSIIRFGGPGAPSFMLKSFEFVLSEIHDHEVSCQPTLSPSGPCLASVVKRNTRYNSLGQTALESVSFSFGSKRSFDSVETLVDSDVDCTAETQEMRCSSPILFQESPLPMVSPDQCGPPVKRRRVRFSDHPPQAFYPSIITPDVSCDESDTADDE